jgi:hypothetical protein
VGILFPVLLNNGTTNSNGFTMAAGYQELFLEQGTDFNTSITLDDVNGVPYDLSLFTAKSQIKKSYYSTSATADFTVSINEPLSGIINLTIDSPTTANIAAGRYVYDVLIKNSSNNITRVLEGIVNVLPRVTVF